MKPLFLILPLLLLLPSRGWAAQEIIVLHKCQGIECCNRDMMGKKLIYLDWKSCASQLEYLAEAVKGGKNG